MPEFGAVISSSGHIYTAPVAQARYRTPDLSLLPGIVCDDEGLSMAPPARLPVLERALVSMPWGALNNYGHFVLDCLSGLAEMTDIPALRSYTPVFPRLHPWQERHLALLGIDDYTCVTGEICYVKDLIFCNTMQSSLHTPNTTYRTLRTRQVRRVRQPSMARSKLYLARMQSPRRNFLTDGDLREQLAQMGFDVVYPEQHSIDEQIQMFRSADVIVGCTGAAFANVLYCETETTVIEIVPLRMVSPRRVGGLWVANICALMGCRWRPYFCESCWATDSVEANREDRAELNTTFELDMKDFMAYLKTIGADG
jgi:capsular polysaccharide biosynthesis protein